MTRFELRQIKSDYPAYQVLLDGKDIGQDLVRVDVTVEVGEPAWVTLEYTAAAVTVRADQVDVDAAPPGDPA